MRDSIDLSTEIDSSGSQVRAANALCLLWMSARNGQKPEKFSFIRYM